MGAFRRRFTPAERESFGAVIVGGAVEWRNGGTWWPANKATEVRTDSDGCQSFMVANLATTATVSKGQPITATPKHVRVPSEGTRVKSGAGQPTYVVHNGRWVRD